MGKVMTTRLSAASSYKPRGELSPQWGFQWAELP